MSLLELGAVVATPGALAALIDADVAPETLLSRHNAGDWGEVSKADAWENERSLKHGWRIVSSYPLTTGARIWIITEADRTSTCMLLPQEY